MGSLFIKNDEAAEIVSRVAEKLGITKTDAILQVFAAYEANLERMERNAGAPEWLKQFWRDHPLPPPTGLKADKEFFDWLSGEENV